MIATVGHRPAFISPRHNERFGKLGEMQHVRAAAAREVAADLNREGAAIGGGVVKLGIHARRGRFQKRTGWPIEVQVAVETRRAQAQHHIVPYVCSKRVGIRCCIGKNGSGLISSVDEGSLCSGDVNTQRRDEHCEGNAEGSAPPPHRTCVHLLLPTREAHMLCHITSESSLIPFIRLWGVHPTCRERPRATLAQPPSPTARKNSWGAARSFSF